MIIPSQLIEKARRHRRPRKCFENSVDIEKPVTIDQDANPMWKRRYLCWEAKGPLADVYRDLAFRILVELNQSRRESSCEVAVSLFMVGKTVRDAKPVIVISSEDKQSREEARHAIERSGILTDSDFQLGLLRYPPSGPIKPVAMEDKPTSQPLPFTPFCEVYIDSQQHPRLVGMPIYVQRGANLVRKATANAVYNGKDYGYITAAHAIKETTTNVLPIDDGLDLGMPFDSDSESDDNLNEQGEIELLSQYSNTSQESSESESSSFSSSEALRSSNRRIPQPQYVPPSSFQQPPGQTQSSAEIQTTAIDQPSDARYRPFGNVSHLIQRVDCGIISVNDVQANKVFAEAKGRQANFEAIKVAKPRQAHIIACTSHGPVHGHLGDVPTLLRIPSTDSMGLVYKFTYKGAIKMGDCGTLVIDADTKELYGLIIANSEKVGVAFMIAAEQIAPEIRQAGNWQFLSLDDPESADNCIPPLVSGHAHANPDFPVPRFVEDAKVPGKQPEPNVSTEQRPLHITKTNESSGKGKWLKRSPSPEEYSDEQDNIRADAKSRKRTRPLFPGSEAYGWPHQLRNAAIAPPAQTPIQKPQSQASPPVSSTPTKPSIIQALPRANDHTTEKLNPEGDEYLPRDIDEAGECKVTQNGSPLDSRQYRCRTFSLPGRGEKLFMLATECARVLGYRDSYLLFNKNRSLYKIIANQAEKDDMIAQEVLPYSYRSRQIAVVTARSMFRQFGSRLIVNGRRVQDDYWESQARKQGFTKEDAAGEKRPGAAKAREAAAAEMAFAHLGALAEANASHSSAGLSFATPYSRMAAGPNGEVFAGSEPYQDRTTSDPQHRYDSSLAQSREVNRQLDMQRMARKTYLYDLWNQPYDGPTQLERLLTPESGHTQQISQIIQPPQMSDLPRDRPPGMGTDHMPLQAQLSQHPSMLTPPQMHTIQGSSSMHGNPPEQDQTMDTWRETGLPSMDQKRRGRNPN